MRCFIIDDAGIAMSPDYGDVMRKVSFDARALRSIAKLTRRARRRMARAGKGRGRRQAVRVSSIVKMRAEPSPPHLFFSRHRLADGAEEVGLYLPPGMSVTDDHLRQVDRAMRSGSRRQAT